MNITFVSNNLSAGGAERVTSILINELANRNIDVRLILFSTKIHFRLNPNVKVIDLSGTRPSKCLFIRVLQHYNRKRRLLASLKQLNSKIVISLLPDTLRYLAQSKRNYKLVASERSNPKYLKNGYKRKMKIKYFNSTDLILYQTLDVAKYYDNIVKTKHLVLPNPVDQSDLYSDYSFSNRRIVAVGNMKMEKDYDTLIKAFAIVTNEYQDATLHIYGRKNATVYESLKHTVDLFDLSKKVYFEGEVNDVKSKIMNARCFVLSSISEGMPNSLMEAMSIGLPVVSTDCDFGPRSLIVDGKNGLLVKNSNHIELSDAIRKVLADNEFSKNIGLNARQSMKKYKISTIVDDLVEALKSLYEEKK